MAATLVVTQKWDKNSCENKLAATHVGQTHWQQHTGSDSEWGRNIGSNTLDETQTWGGNGGGNTLEETHSGTETVVGTH